MHQRDQTQYQNDRADDARDYDLCGLERNGALLVSGAPPNAKKRPAYGLDHLERRCACRFTLLRHFHQLAFLAVPSISKNEYDSVIVWMSSGSPRSMTKTTGIWRASPGCSVCCVKQKHSSFLK